MTEQEKAKFEELYSNGDYEAIEYLEDKMESNEDKDLIIFLLQLNNITFGYEDLIYKKNKNLFFDLENLYIDVKCELLKKYGLLEVIADL